MAETESSLHISNLYKHYGKHPVLQGVELEVAPATIHGLVGLNGAGKTTSMECLLGLQHYQQGTISLLGHAPTDLYRSRGKVAAVFDEPCLQPHFSVEEVLRFAQLTVGSKDIDYLNHVLQRLGIERYRQFKTKNLSLGNRRRAAIAQALVSKPEFIVLDEPFNGLDAGGVDDVLALIKSLNQEQGITFLLASHQLPYLETVCSHMSILHHGRVAKTGSLESLLVHEHERVTINVDDIAAARKLIGTLSGVRLLEPQEDNDIHCDLLEISSAQLNCALVEAQIDVNEIKRQRPSLEHLFRGITGASS